MRMILPDMEAIFSERESHGVFKKHIQEETVFASILIIILFKK
jgi:hypothetical protein